MRPLLRWCCLLPNLPGLLGMSASMRLLMDVGIERVSSRITGLRALLRDGAAELGYEVYSEPPEGAVSGILTLFHGAQDLPRVAGRLAEGGIRASLRQDRSGRPLLRFSPHFYNTEAEVGRVLEVLARVGDR